MTISVKCKKCKQGYKLGDDKAGKRFKCRKCGAPVSVPKADDFDDDFGDDFGDEHDDEYGDEPEDVAPARPRKSSSTKSAGKKGKKKGSKKSSGKSPVIFIVGGVVALLLVIGSVIGGIFIFGGDDEPDLNAKKIIADAKEEPKKKAAKPRDRNGPLHLAFLPDNCFGAFVIQPQRLQQSEAAKQLLGNVPVESSVDPREMEMLVFFLTTPKSAGPEPPRDEFFAVVMRSTKPINVQEVAKEQIADGSEPESVIFQKQTYLRIPLKSQKVSANPSSGPLGVCAIDEKTIILGLEDQVKKMLAPTARTDTQIYARLEKLDLNNDIIGLVMISELYKNEKTRSLLETAESDLSQNLPPDRQDLLALPESIESITASINISGGSLLKLSFEGKDSSSAEKLHLKAKEAETELKQMYAAIQQAPPPQQPPGFAMMKGIIDPLIAAFSVNKDAQNVILELKKPVDLEQALAPILAAAFSQAQVAAPRSVTRNKLKRVGLALLNYVERHASLPPQNKAEFFASDGQPKLSWRVHLLPFLGEEELFDKFKLDEPWDSPNNKPLINEMPDVFRLDVLDSGGKTRLVVLVGPGTPFHNLKQRGPNFAEFTDGTSNTLLALEVGADKAIEWTKPESDNFDPKNPLAALGNIPPGFNVLFADGRVETLSSDKLLAKSLKAIATHQGKEEFDVNELRKAGPSDSGGSVPPSSPPVKPAQPTDPVAGQPKKPANKPPGKVNGRLDNNLKCVDLSDLTGPLPLNVLSSTKILERSEPWEYSSWTLIAKEDDTVGYPSMVHNDRGKNPDGKYYLYYAHHDPTSGIACAIADSIAGPYHKLAKLDDSRKHSMVLVNPHYPARIGDPSHYSSPSVVWNEDEKLWFMYFHYYNHYHRLWEEHADYPGGGNQMTALATSPDLSSHDWTIVEDEGTDKVNIPKLMPVLPTTKESWMYGTSSYHSIQRLPTGEWLAFLRGTDKKGACSVGFARSADGRKWSLFPKNPMIRPRSGRDAALGIYRPGFIGYLGKDSAGKHKYLVVWAQSRKGMDVPRIRYGYTTDFVRIIPDRRGFANWPGGDGLISTWRVDDKLYLFAAKYLHVMRLPVASK